MTVKEKIQRAAAAAVLSRMIKYVRKDPDTNLVKLIDKSELFVGNIFPAKNFDSFREGAKDPDNIWRQLGLRLLNETDDNVIMNMALALGLGAAVNGTKAVRTNREKYHCNIPWVILLDPTSACNRKCKGCWSAEYGHKQSLTFDELNDIVNQGVAMGTHFYMFTGGEPLLQPDIEAFISRVRELGYSVKLDTNGTFPDKLRALIDAGLVDYVAMDIKNSPEKYAETVGLEKFDMEPIFESVRLLMGGETDFEFRTTVVRELHSAEDFEKIGEWLKGDEKYFLQSFTDSDFVLQKGLSAHSRETLRTFADIVRKNVPRVEIRGV